MLYTYGARIKRRLVVVASYVSCKSTLAVALRTCSEKQATTQRFRDVVTMESIARVRDLIVMPASFAANYHSSLWTSWISCRPMCCGFRCLGMWIS